MINSTNDYNFSPISVYANPTAKLPITLNGKAIDYRKSPNITSILYPDCSYHFEFWIFKGILFACLHVRHHNQNINTNILAKLIDSNAASYVSDIKTKLGINVINFPFRPGFSGIGVMPRDLTHTLNIACPGYELSHLINKQINPELKKENGQIYSGGINNDSVSNAKIMRCIIQTTSKLCI